MPILLLLIAVIVYAIGWLAGYTTAAVLAEAKNKKVKTEDLYPRK